jgi:hypothetical protein
LRIAATPTLPVWFRLEDCPLSSTILFALCRPPTQSAMAAGSDWVLSPPPLPQLQTQAARNRVFRPMPCRWLRREALESAGAACGDCRNRLITTPCKTRRPVRLNHSRKRSFTGIEVFFPQSSAGTKRGNNHGCCERQPACTTLH